MIFRLKTFVILAAFLMLGTLSGSLKASAEIAEQPCSTQFWKQMSARAWMEAEREIMMN